MEKLDVFVIVYLDNILIYLNEPDNIDFVSKSSNNWKNICCILI